MMRAKIALTSYIGLSAKAVMGSTTFLEQSWTPKFGLPRFNMPLELGIFLGAKQFGGKQQNGKKIIVFDKDPHRFKIFISDIGGVDITSHDGETPKMVKSVREWLIGASRLKIAVTVDQLSTNYASFSAGLPTIARSVGLDPDDLHYVDFYKLVVEWVQQQRDKGALPAI